jgi:PGF-CTERM protein
VSSVYGPVPAVDKPLLAALYAAELSLLIMILAVHRLGDRVLASSLDSNPGMGFVVALLAFLVAAAIIARRYLRSRGLERRSFAFTAAMNVITLALVFVTAEIGLRLLFSGTSAAALFLDRTMSPRTWEKTAAINRQTLEEASRRLSFLVYDETLGWTVGHDRSGSNGLHLSSAEGLRAARRGAVLAGPKTRTRIAIVGDSFAFAEQVEFKESWGHLLEVNSAGRFEVLNFGVPGYSIDQAYLRFRKDVLAWQPDIVILGFPLTDLHRTLTVYPFIMHPHWHMPFSKPRSVWDGNALRIVNVPTISPRAIFAQRSIQDLPFLEYEAGYHPTHWQPGFADLSYVKRLLFGVAAPWPVLAHEEVVRVNGAVFDEFRRLAADAGIIALIAYFPARRELLELSPGGQTEGQRIMKEMGIPFLDTTGCVSEVGPDAGYVPNDTHYSPSGNAAVARCVGAALRNVLPPAPRAASGFVGPGRGKEKVNR